MNFKVNVAKPIIDVILVLLFKPSILIKRRVHSSKQERHFKATLVQFELRINQREDTPANHIVFRHGVGLEKYQFEQKDVRGLNFRGH